MYSAGDKLLFILNAKKEMQWHAFKKAVDALYLSDLRSNENDSQHSEYDSKIWKYATLRNFDMLGHCTSSFSSSERIIKIAPAVMTCLPHAGCSKAVLVGSRTPELVDQLVGYTQIRDGVDLSITEHQLEIGIVPAVIMVRAMEVQEITDVAAHLGVKVATIPSAWSLINVCGTIHAYLESLRWEKNIRLNWARREYDVRNLCFVEHELDHDYKLEQYINPINKQFNYFFCKNGMKAEVDKDWGKFIVLSQSCTSVIYYDAKKFILGVPARLPLPRLYARALAFCSGKLPVKYNLPSDLVKQGVCGPLMLYKSVPDSIACLAAEKLNQLLTSISFN